MTDEQSAVLRMKEQAEKYAKAHQPIMLSDIRLPKQEQIGTTKAGVLPYIFEEGKIKFYLLKPVSQRGDDPGFQIPKGTPKGTNAEGEFVDIDPKLFNENPLAYNPFESPAETGIRESIEEAGLVTENIQTFTNSGIHRFKSAKSGKEKSMILYPAEMIDPENFVAPHPTLASTAERGWFDITDPAQAKKIRSDHLEILKNVQEKLIAFHQGKGHSKTDRQPGK